MKRWFSLCLCVLLFSLMTCACQVRQPSPEETLNFPGISWGMTPEEALSALDVDQGNTQEQTSASTRSIQYSPDGPIFGLTPAFIRLDFEVSGSQQALTDILAVYEGVSPDRVEILRSGLSDRYGPLKDHPILGVGYGPSRSLDPTWKTFDNQDSLVHSYWTSAQVYSDLLTPEESAAYQQLLPEDDRYPSYWDNPAYWELYTEFTPVATIELNGNDNEYYSQYPGGACLIHFSAREFVSLGLKAETLEASPS